MQWQRLRRKEASRYLKDQWGIDRAPSTLAKLAVVGGGPRFEHAGRIPLYPVPELDRWAKGLFTGLKSSTSDVGAQPDDADRAYGEVDPSIAPTQPVRFSLVADGDQPKDGIDQGPA